MSAISAVKLLGFVSTNSLPLPKCLRRHRLLIRPRSLHMLGCHWWNQSVAGPHSGISIPKPMYRLRSLSVLCCLSSAVETHRFSSLSSAQTCLAFLEKNCFCERRVFGLVLCNFSFNHESQFRKPPKLPSHDKNWALPALAPSPFLAGCSFPKKHGKVWTCWELSSFSTQHAQRCVPARSFVTQWVCYPEKSCECIFLNKRNAFGDVEAYRRPKTEPQRRMHFFRFTNRLLQLVLLNSCLNYCCLRNCLRPQRSPPASGMGSNRDFEHEVTTPPPVQRRPEAAENTPGRRELLKQQQLH